MITSEALIALIASVAITGFSTTHVDEIKSSFLQNKQREIRTVCEVKSHGVPESDRSAVLRSCLNNSAAQFNQRAGAAWHVSL